MSKRYVKHFLNARKMAEKELEELEKMTPEFMNTMMNKQSREDAIRKRDERKAMSVEDVPPTAAGRKTEFINKD